MHIHKHTPMYTHICMHTHTMDTHAHIYSLVLTLAHTSTPLPNYGLSIKRDYTKMYVWCMFDSLLFSISIHTIYSVLDISSVCVYVYV